MFLSAVSRLLPALDPRGVMGSLGGKVGNACEDFEDNEGVYWVNNSESSGTGLPHSTGPEHVGPIPNHNLHLCALSATFKSDDVYVCRKKNNENRHDSFANFPLCLVVSF